VKKMRGHLHRKRRLRKAKELGPLLEISGERKNSYTKTKILRVIAAVSIVSTPGLKRAGEEKAAPAQPQLFEYSAS